MWLLSCVYLFFLPQPLDVYPPCSLAAASLTAPGSWALLHLTGFYLTAFLDQKKVLGSPGTGITEGCELSCRCWDPNPGPMQSNKCS